MARPLPANDVTGEMTNENPSETDSGQEDECGQVQGGYLRDSCVLGAAMLGGCASQLLHDVATFLSGYSGNARGKFARFGWIFVQVSLKMDAKKTRFIHRVIQSQSRRLHALKFFLLGMGIPILKLAVLFGVYLKITQPLGPESSYAPTVSQLTGIVNIFLQGKYMVLYRTILKVHIQFKFVVSCILLCYTELN